MSAVTPAVDTSLRHVLTIDAWPDERRVDIQRPPGHRRTMPCNLCGSCQQTELFPAGRAQAHRIVQCSLCGLMYADPLGTPEHKSIEAWPDDPNWNPEVESPQRCEKERLQVGDYQSWIALLAEKYPKRGRLVEVGSSLGYLLAACRDDGWEVTGIEPDINGCRHSAKLGLHSIHSVLEEAHLPTESSDVVVMLHVIEHVPNPLGTLREIWRILKPGGRAVVETPRYDTLMFRLLGWRERSLRCNGHVYFFTTKTLRLACQEAGFVVEHTEYPARTLTLDRLAYNLAVVAGGGRWQGNEFSRRMRLQDHSVRLNLRDIQRVLLLKPSGPAPVVS